MPNLLDTLLWRYSLAYRRYKIKRSAAWRVLNEPLPARQPLHGLHVDAPDTADYVPYMGISRDEYPKLRATISPYEALMAAKLEDFRATPRRMEQWSEPERFCEHCPIRGHCNVCGREHAPRGAAE